MFYEESNIQPVCRALNITEDLGQVSHGIEHVNIGMIFYSVHIWLAAQCSTLSKE